MSEKLTASLEDYIEAIASLAGSSGETRAADIADTLGVSRPSVTVALRALASRKMVNYRPYSTVSLTEDGRKHATAVLRKHRILGRFFNEILGADEELADSAACRVEHAIGEEITDRLVDFLAFIDNCPIAAEGGFEYNSEKRKNFRKEEGAADGKS
ncbi:MAG: metal-dependent transcriptional regulator [Candidatus Sabulitectum sp.]|nr:metal-dependent transcriptional regulator [Candidatus Sabulitectum sp.]